MQLLMKLWQKNTESLKEVEQLRLEKIVNLMYFWHLLMCLVLLLILKCLEMLAC